MTKRKLMAMACWDASLFFYIKYQVRTVGKIVGRMFETNGFQLITIKVFFSSKEQDIRWLQEYLERRHMISDGMATTSTSSFYILLNIFINETKQSTLLEV